MAVDVTFGARPHPLAPLHSNGEGWRSRGEAIAETPTGRAIVEAAVQRRVGAPVYLRYAFETAGGDLLSQAAGALEFAVQVLGPMTDVYAVATPDGDGAPVHLSLTVRHAGGAVALLGIGAGTGDAAAPPIPPTVFLLGDRGSVEGLPAPQLPTGITSPPGPLSIPWRGGAEGGGEARTPKATSTSIDPLVDAIRRSLVTGQPQPVTANG